MHLLFMADGYPTKTEPVFSFVGELVRELARQGHECEVIAPQSITAIMLKRAERRPVEWRDSVDGGYSVTVHQPYYVSFSNSPFTKAAKTRVVKRELMLRQRSGSVLYAHFWGSALPAAMGVKFTENTLIVATGESSIPSFSPAELTRLTECVDGVVAVSTKNKNESIEKGCLRSDGNVVVLPNAVSEDFFQRYNKELCRKDLGLETDNPIALFVGHFSERKGSGRVDEALTRVGGISSVFLGAGEIPPVGNHCLFAGRVSHELLPKYLAACDMFVLPTLAEGCCNAVVEALAMGVPVISSDLPFNWDVLDDTCAILVDPEDVDEICQAISRLRDDSELRASMSLAARKKATSLKLFNRAQAISEFIATAKEKKRR